MPIEFLDGINCDEETGIATISKDVNEIDLDFIGSEFSAESIYVEKGNPNYCDVNGVLINKDMTKLSLYPSNREDRIYTIPEGVKKIFNKAFFCNRLNKVIMPNSVEEIGEYAFSYSPILNTIVLPENIKEIKPFVFSSCSYLESITIPDSVEKISIDAFSGDEDLRHIYISQHTIDKNRNFFDFYEYLIEIKQPKTLAELLDEGLSLREANRIMKERELRNKK